MNWAWLEGIPYFVVTAEWASGWSRRKSMVKVCPAHSSCQVGTALPRGLCQSPYTHSSTASMCQGAMPSALPREHSTAEGGRAEGARWQAGALLYLGRAVAPG